MGILPVEFGTKKKNFRKPDVRNIDLILAMTVYLPIGHSHCARARFTVLISCRYELTFHSSALICPQRQDAKFLSGLFRSLLRNNDIKLRLNVSLQTLI